MFDTGNDKSSENDFPRLTKGNQFGISLFYILQVVAFALAVFNLVYSASNYNYGDDANNAVKNLQEELRDADLIENGCMTCDRNTGELTFNSTIDVVRSKIDSFAHFTDENNEGTGITFPGYAFSNSPLADNGFPTFLGDAVMAVESGIDQSSYGLPTAKAPDGYTLNQQPPNPTGFNAKKDSGKQADIALGIGQFRESKSDSRCNPSEMAPSPAVYFVLKDSVSPATRHLCICVSNNAEFGPGAGEHCTTATFGTSVF